MLGNVKDICDSSQPNGFTCPNGRTVFSSSVIWGAIGPARSYSIAKIYSGLLHFFWIGALAPVITWAIWKWKGGEFWRLINWPLIFVGTYNVPPATVSSSSSSLLVLIFRVAIWVWILAWDWDWGWETCLIFLNRELIIRHGHWWTWSSTSGFERSILLGGLNTIMVTLPLLYTAILLWTPVTNQITVLAAALDTGIALSAIVIFFCKYPLLPFSANPLSYESLISILNCSWIWETTKANPA